MLRPYQREAIDAERERQLSLRREPLAGREASREDLATKAIGHRVDDAGASDGADGGERVRGVGGCASRHAWVGGSAGHWLIHWFNHFVALAPRPRNPVRSKIRFAHAISEANVTFEP